MEATRLPPTRPEGLREALFQFGKGCAGHVVVLEEVDYEPLRRGLVGEGLSPKNEPAPIE